MNKIIFLDIDGVLNSRKYFIENHKYILMHKRILDFKKDNERLEADMLDLDPEKIYLLKNITEITGAKIVITSTWRGIRLYSLIEEELINKYHLPIIGSTPLISPSCRGEEVRYYLEENKVDDFVIIDDDIFEDFDELVYNLVLTSNNEGMTYETHEEVVRRLGKRFLIKR